MWILNCMFLDWILIIASFVRVLVNLCELMSHYESNIYYAQKTVFCNHTNGVHRMRWEWINTKYHTMINKVERKIGFWRNSIFIVQFGDCFSCHSCHVTRPRNIPHCLYFKNKLNIDITSKYYKIRIQYGVQIHKIEAEVFSIPCELSN